MSAASIRLYQPSSWRPYGPEAELVTPDGQIAQLCGHWANLVQKWLGHAQLSTTAVYANAVGAEEKDIARRMWG
jgi:integrase